jgi:hypothetical protein
MPSLYRLITSKILERPSRIRPADEKDTNSLERDSKPPSDSDSDDLEEVGGQSILFLDHFHCTEVVSQFALVYPFPNDDL